MWHASLLQDPRIALWWPHECGSEEGIAIAVPNWEFHTFVEESMCNGESIDVNNWESFQWFPKCQCQAAATEVVVSWYVFGRNRAQPATCCMFSYSYSPVFLRFSQVMRGCPTNKGLELWTLQHVASSAFRKLFCPKRSKNSPCHLMKCGKRKIQIMLAK